MTRSRWRVFRGNEGEICFHPPSLLLLPSLPRRHRIPHASRPTTISTILKYQCTTYRILIEHNFNHQSVKYADCTIALDVAGSHTPTVSRSNQVGTESLGREATLIPHHQHKVGRQSRHKYRASVLLVGLRRD